MTRFAMLAIVCVTSLFLAAGVARAQTPKSAEGRYSAEITAAATLGHKSDSAFGAELDYRFNDDWDVFVEAGRMGNVASSALDARAQVIANAIGASTSLVQRAAYFDVGGRYRLMARGRWDPYVMLGFGAASVKTRTNFSINGVDVTNGDLVRVGTDLAGTLAKPFLTIGAGATMPFKHRYFVDLSYRYGRIFARTSQIENDNGVNTQRVQLGVGVKF
jgi:opacity protein-like surface antigen